MIHDMMIKRDDNMTGLWMDCFFVLFILWWLYLKFSPFLIVNGVWMDYYDHMAVCQNLVPPGEHQNI